MVPGLSPGVAARFGGASRAIHRTPVRASLARLLSNRLRRSRCSGVFVSRRATPHTRRPDLFSQSGRAPHRGGGHPQGVRLPDSVSEGGSDAAGGAEVTIRNALPFFTGAVVRDESLRERLLRFHYAVAEGAPTLSVESTPIDALAHLIRRHADDRRSRSRGLNERTAVRKAREYIEAHYDAEVSLWELATPVHLSPFYFARAFQKEVGLPPHAYLENIRVKRARELLLCGVPITDVYAAVGYADQSHLTNRFKRLLGMTPGQVARSRETASVTPGGRPMTSVGC